MRKPILEKTSLFRLILFLSFCLIAPLLKAQKDLSSLGHPAISNYAPKDYDGAQQVWSVIQDDRGFLYFGVQPGLLEYDGTQWRKISLGEKSQQIARSLDKDDQGRIYIGGVGQLGYLDVDVFGQTRFNSLLDKIPQKYLGFADVWDTWCANDKTFFSVGDNIFQWKPGMDSMRVYEGGETPFHASFVVNNQFYTRQWGKGLLKMNDNEALELVPDGARFADERIYVMLPYDENQILVGTRTQGLFLYDGLRFKPFKTEIDPYLEENDLYLPGCVLNNGNFALNTIGAGILIMDKNGKLVQQIDVDAGLRDNFVTYSYLDKNGSLWAALTDGMAKIEIGSPLSYYSNRIGISSSILSISQSQGTYYAGAEGPLYYFNASQKQFQEVKGAGSQTFSLIQSGGQLLAGNYDGVQRIVGDQAIPIRENLQNEYSTTFMHLYKKDSSFLFTGVTGGLGLLKRLPNGDWEDKGILAGFDNSVWWIEEESDGTLWLSDQVEGATRLRFPNWPDLKDPEFKNYGVEQGLADDSYIFYHDQQLYGQSYTGVTKYNPATDSFERDSTFGAEATFLFKGENGEVLVNLTEQKGLALARPNGDGTYTLDKAAFSPLADDIITNVYPDPKNNNLWIGSNEGLTLYNPDKELTESHDFQALIRKVVVGNDSLLPISEAPVKLSFKNKQILFEFAAPYFIQEDKIQYQVRLEGFDQKWSNWLSRTEKEYLNLSAGDYTFKVRARNLFDQVSEPVHYSFTVLPPWYLSWWALFLYIIAAAALVFSLVAWRTNQFRKNEEQLRKKVEESTMEIRQRLGELESVNQVSKAIAAQLELDALIVLVGDQMRDLFKADMVYVALLDEQKNMINFPYGFGDDFPAIKFGEGLTSKVIKTGKALLINEDVTGSYSRLGIEEIGKRSSSYLGVPIPTGNEIIGVVSIQSTNPNRQFKESDKKLLNTIAASIGVAIHNAQLFKETQQAKSEAESANEAKTSFLSTVSHELRTPLTSILGFTKIIQKRFKERIRPIIPLEDPKVVKTVQQIDQNLDVVISEGKRLTTLINDVLDLAKIEAGEIDWHLEEVSINSIVQQAQAATSSLFDQKGLKYQAQFDDHLPMVIADKDKVIQVLINLFSNAVKFTNQGQVTATTSSNDREVIIQIKDTGIGIDQKDLPKVFDKFRQVGDTLTDKPKGTGLGLPISKEIIEQLGGRIWIESKPEVGSTFSFSLPIKAKEKNIKGKEILLQELVSELKKKVPLSASNVLHPNQQNILVVDDEAPIRELLRQELSEIGYSVSLAEDGKQALKMIREKHPDMIILDVMMPELNGFDLAAILKNDPKTMNIPILILSIVKDLERGYRIGVDRFLNKPIDTKVLFSEIENLLTQGSSTKKVLIVDESASTIKTLSQALLTGGYQVMDAGGANMLEKAKSELPDVIILNSLLEERENIIKSIRFEKGLENVLFLMYQ